jgi:hypothetical protein
LDRFKHHAMLGILPNVLRKLAHYRSFPRIGASANAKRAQGFAL